MTITQLIDTLEYYTPDGYEFWSGLHRSAYNQEKQINDTMLVVFPNPFPADWRGLCSHPVDVEIWFGKVIDIKRTTELNNQHDPYSPIDTVQELHDLANEFITSVADDDYILLTESAPLEFFDSPDGKSVNRQVWLKTVLTMRIWYKENDLTNVIFVDDNVIFNEINTTYEQ